MPYVYKNAKDLSPAEKQAYVNAFLKIKEKKRNESAQVSIFDELALIHRVVPNLLLGSQNHHVAHRASDFLPWHRAYLRDFYNALKSVDDTGLVTLVYWDWFDPESTKAVFSLDFAGPFVPGPLQGSFEGLPETYPNVGRLVWRSPPEDDVDAVFANLKKDYEDAMNGNLDYHQFALKLEGWHDTGHVSISGSMARLQTAANDPVFFIHHCNVDRIWNLWQDRGNHGIEKFKQFTTTRRASELGTHIDQRMYPWDGAQHNFAIEPETEREILKPFLATLSIVYVRDMWLTRPTQIGFDKIAPKLRLGVSTPFEIRADESLVIPFEVPKVADEAPFKIKTIGEPRLLLRLHGPVYCANCYGHLAATDANAGPDGPRIVTTLNEGRYNLVVYANNVTVQNLKPFHVLISVIQDEDVPITLPPHQEDPVPHAAPAAPIVPHVLEKKGIPDPHPRHVRAIPLEQNQVVEANYIGHGEVNYFSFIVLHASNVNVDIRGVKEASIILVRGRPPGKFVGLAQTTDNDHASIHATLEPAKYFINVRSTACVPGRFTILVGQSQVH